MRVWVLIAFVSFASSAWASAELAACRDRIKTIICPVLPPTKGVDRRKRDCQPGGETYARHFEGHFDRSSDLIKRMYCHLDKLWIEKEFFGTAYAVPISNGNGLVTAGGVGIRQEVLDSPPSFDAWLNWKEESSFGGGVLLSAKPLGLIQYSSNRNTPEFFIDYVLNHEFGHLFDYANELNEIIDCQFKKDADGRWKYVGSCAAKAGSWTALSWQDRKMPIPAADFPWRKDLCFYTCYGHFLEAKNAAALFKGLMTSPFQSTYAAKDFLEDFADTFAMKLAHDQGLRYTLTVSGQSFDLSAHFASPLMRPKLDYVEKFLSGKIYYPGE